MQRFLKYILCMAALIPLAACEKELNPEYHVIPPVPVIQGIYSQDGPEVLLTHTTPMEDPMDNTPITDANVTIEDLEDPSALLELTPDAEGRFTCDGAPVPVPGHTYRLTVEREEGLFTSEAMMMPPVQIAGLNWVWVKMPYGYVAVLQVAVAENPDLDEQIWVRMFRNGELYEWTYSYDRYFKDGITLINIVTTKQDTSEEDDSKTLLDGDVIDIEVMSVDDRLCQWFKSLVNTQNSNGDALFSGPECLGYFLPAYVAKKQIIFHPDEITEKI